MTTNMLTTIPPGKLIADEITTRLAIIAKDSLAGGMKGLLVGVGLTALEIRARLSESHSGPIYGGHSPNPASLPGEPPALQSGHLRNSYNFAPSGTNSVILGSNALYAPFLEFGTVNMAPRPVLRPAVEKMLAVIAEKVSTGIQEAQHLLASAARFGGAGLLG